MAADEKAIGSGTGRKKIDDVSADDVARLRERVELIGVVVEQQERDESEGKSCACAVAGAVRKMRGEIMLRDLHTEIEARVKSIMKQFTEPWRWFRDGIWIVMEPPDSVISAATMRYMLAHSQVTRPEAVFRTTPHPGIYLRFRLKDVAP